jgi:hypothetical protein
MTLIGLSRTQDATRLSITTFCMTICSITTFSIAIKASHSAYDTQYDSEKNATLSITSC